MDYCDMCGKQSGEMYSVIVEGAHMIACERCSKGNTILSKIEPILNFGTQKLSKSNNETEVVEDFGAIIKNAREKSGLTLEQFGLKINEKESTLRRVEEGKGLPTDQLAAKLEHALGIKLIVPAEKTGAVHLSKDEPITLWDAAYKKEKKNLPGGE